jgi:hypothetical protein
MPDFVGTRLHPPERPDGRSVHVPCSANRPHDEDETMKKILLALAGAAVALVTVVAPAGAANAATATTTISAKAASSTVVRGKTDAVTVTVRTGSKAATGAVYVYDGAKKVKTLTLKSGKATYTTAATAARGAHTFKFVHAKTKKSKTVSVTVKSKVAWSVKATATTYTRESTLPKINVTTTADGKAVNGTVYVREGSKTVATRATSGGKASVQVPASLAKGTHRLTVSFTTTTKYLVAPAALTLTFTTKSNVVVAGDGVYRVGSTIKPGLYVSKGNDFCYWERNSGLSGDFDDLIANDIGSGTRYVRIAAGDVAFTSDGCSPWYAASSTGSPATSISGDGQLRVGVDIAPGTYQTTTSTTGCYWERLSDATGSFDDMIANDYGDGVRLVQIQTTDAFVTFSDCGKWTKVG